MTDLYKKDNYFTTKTQYAFNKYCIEYDMKSAGLSLCKQFNLLPSDVISDLEKNYKKSDRDKKLGKLQIKNDSLRNGLKQAFVEGRRLFVEANDIEDDDIITIKKDAIFVNKICEHLEFGKYIKFVNKNQYTSFIRFPNKIEIFYFCGKIDVKGIGDTNIHKHDNGIIKILSSFFKKIESEDISSVRRFMKSVIDKYKFKELPIECYREFNAQSLYTVFDEDGEVCNFDDYWVDKIDDVILNYNWENIILPLLKIIY